MFGFLLGIGSLIAGFFQTSIDAIVASLVWAVGAIQATIIALWNGIKGALDIARIGFSKVWDFFRPIYTEVLQPAWKKFWTWFDTARKWLSDTFGPVLDFLYNLRAQLIGFWQTYVRPWLDLIDVVRKTASVLASLGLEWARRLDTALGELEQKIEAPFLFLLGKLNEVINIINTVVGADGLFQRAAFIRTLARDYQQAWQAIMWPYSDSIDQGARDTLKNGIAARTLDDIENETRTYLADGSGPLAPAVRAAVAAYHARGAVTP